MGTVNRVRLRQPAELPQRLDEESQGGGQLVASAFFFGLERGRRRRAPLRSLAILHLLRGACGGER